MMMMMIRRRMMTKMSYDYADDCNSLKNGDMNHGGDDD